MQNIYTSKSELTNNYDSMRRNIDNIVYQICYIVSSDLTVEYTLKSKWAVQLSWFEQFQNDVLSLKYIQYPPEFIEEMKWYQLANIINGFLQRPNLSSWEKQILQVFQGNYIKDDLPNLYDRYVIDVFPEDDDDIFAIMDRDFEYAKHGIENV